MKLNNLLVTAFAAVGLSACASLGFEDKRPAEVIVAERSQERLDALMEKSTEGLEAALKYTTPSYQKHMTAGRYNVLVAGRGFWNEAKVKSVTCEEDVCDVITLVTYTSPQMGFPVERPLDEKWIKIENNWWIYHK